MPETDHPTLRFAPFLKDLAEGRLELQDLNQWWSENAATAQAMMPPGWFLRLKMWTEDTESPHRKMAMAVRSASYVLTALKVAHTPTDRHERALEAEFEAYRAAQQCALKERQLQLKPIFERIKANFPKFAKILEKRVDLVTELEVGATDDELAATEKSLGVPLPSRFRELLLASRSIVAEGLRIDVDSLFFHKFDTGIQSPSEGYLCFADYFLEADGDQMLFNPKDLPADDPPVYYYAHSIPKVRNTKKTFSTWIEGLARSPLFRS